MPVKNRKKEVHKCLWIYFISESIVYEPIRVEVKVGGKEKGTRREFLERERNTEW